MRQAALLLLLTCLTGCGAAAPDGQNLANWINGRDQQVRQDVAAILHGMRNEQARARDVATIRDP